MARGQLAPLGQPHLATSDRGRLVREFAPASKPAVEAMDAFEPCRLDVRAPELHAGALYLFHGRESLHRVTPVVSGQRVNAILTFNADPAERMNEYTRLKFFGRRLALADA